MVKFIHAAAIALLSAAMFPSGQAAYACTTQIWGSEDIPVGGGKGGPDSPFLMASDADADALNAMEFAQTAMQAYCADSCTVDDNVFSINPPQDTDPTEVPVFDGSDGFADLSWVHDNDILYVDIRICSRQCVVNGLNNLTGSDRYPQQTVNSCRTCHGPAQIYKGYKGIFYFSNYSDDTANAVDECNLYTKALNAATGQENPVKGKKGKKGKKGSAKSPKGPKSPKGTRSPKSPKAPKGKVAALKAKQSQAAKLEVGAGVALVGMVGLVALVATKLCPPVAAEDETALLTAVPSLVAATEALPVMV